MTSLHQAFLQDIAAAVNLGKDSQVKQKEERPVILVTTVDIGGGNSDRIELKKGDEPIDAAKAFCRKHNLPASIVGPLTQHILENLRKANKTPDSKPRVELRDDPHRDASPAAPIFAESPDHIPSAYDKSLQPDKQQQFSFANPDNDKIFEQLSAKLLPAANSRTNNKTVMSASDFLSGGKLSSSSQDRQSRQSYSAEPTPRDSVHLRLYSGALDRAARMEERRKMQAAEAVANVHNSRASISWISAEMMRGRSAGLYENYGEMLYAEGLEADQIKMKRVELAKLERASKELEGVTFHPAITKKAQELRARDMAVEEGDADAAWHRLGQGMRQSTIARMEDMRRAREESEVKECTFRPNINRTSDMMMAERSETLKVLNITHHEQLFQDALRRQHKMSELANWYPDDVTFQPQINTDARAKEYLRRSFDKVARDSPREGANKDLPRVVERLYASYEKRNTKLEEARNKFQGPLDPATGKPLYRPETGRGPKNFARNKDGKPIGEYLYTVALEQANKKAQTEEQERKAAEVEASRSHASASSQKLFLKLKLKRFSQIFDYLDEGGLGLVDLVGLVRGCGTRIDNLDPEVLLDVELAAGIWAKAHDVSLAPEALAAGEPLPSCPPMSQEQFMAVMEQALASRRAPRAYLVPSPSNKHQPDHTFQPAINKKSKEMAARLRPPEVALHELLHQNAARTHEKLEAVRKEKVDAELRDCTFQPQLNASSKAVEGRAMRLSRNTSRQTHGPVIIDELSGAASPHGHGMSSPRVAASAYSANGGGPGGAPRSPGSSVYPRNDVEGNEEFVALEQELSDMMAATNLAAQRLNQMSARSQELNSSDLTEQALEDLLLETLACGGPEGAASSVALEQLMQRYASGQSSSPPAQQHQQLRSAQGSAAPSRRTTKDASMGQATVSMYVMPVGVEGGGAQPGSASLADLADAMAQWDHNADPTLSTL